MNPWALALVLVLGSTPGGGGRIYAARCAACHGARGGGDGPLAEGLEAVHVRPRNFLYREALRGRTDAELEDLVARGGAAYGLSNLMPPWGRTLSRAQIRAVVRYVRTLPVRHAEPTAAETSTFRRARPIPYAQAATLFALYCVDCHGRGGQGDGVAAVTLRDLYGVAPMDLTDPKGIGTRSDEQLFEIINGGGPRVGRSPAMPPWGLTLTPDEIVGIVRYLRTLENRGPRFLPVGRPVAPVLDGTSGAMRDGTADGVAP